MYPGLVFRDYAILGDDIVIADQEVSEVYAQSLEKLGLTISKKKSLISDTGAAEFAKRFIIKDMSKDISPVSIRAL